MELNIIHLEDRIDRKILLDIEISTQNIVDFKMWEGVRDENVPKRGIVKAHKQIIEWAKNKNLETVMIAEDDIKFTAPNALEFFRKNEPQDYDIYLGGIIYGTLEDDNSTNDFSGMTLYKIQRKFYETFLSLPEDFDIDRSLANKGKFIVCNPFVVTQYNGFSDNIKDYRNYDPYLRNRKLFGS